MSLAGPIYGPVFIGVFLDLLLLGIIVSQIFVYHETQKRDYTWIKLYISGLFAAGIINTVFNVFAIYFSLVKNFGDVGQLGDVTWAPALQTVIAFMVQLFMGWRINILYSNIWLMAAIVLVSVGQLLTGIGTTIAFHRVHNFGRMGDIKSIFIPWVVCSAVVDITIAGSLIFYAVEHMPSKMSKVSQLSRIFLPTGLITAIFAVVQLVVYFASTPGVTMLFGIVLPKLYIVSLVSSLNSREGWKYSQESQLDISNVQYTDEAKNRPVFNHKPEIIPLGDLGTVGEIEEDHKPNSLNHSRLSIPSFGLKRSHV